MFIDKAQCQMGKYSNNLEKHGEEDVLAWTIPIVGVLLYAHQLEVLLHDSHGSEAFFVRAKDDLLEARPWTTYADPVSLTEAYDGVAVEMKLGEEVISFERCRIKDLTLGRFFQGGVTQVDFKLQIAPGLDRVNLLMQEYQNKPVVLTIESAKVAAKKKLKQTDWLTQAAPATPEGDAGKPVEISNSSPATTDGVGSNDPLYGQAVDFVLESRITKLDAVAAHFRIDLARANLMLGAMELDCIVGPRHEDSSREILEAEVAEPGETVPGGGEPEEDEDSDEGDEPEDEGIVVYAPEGDAPESIVGDPPNAQPPMEMAQPTSRVGRAVTAHAKRQARKSRAKKNGEARAH